MSVLSRFGITAPRRTAAVRDVIDATAIDLAGKANTIDWILQSVLKADPLTRPTALKNASKAADELALAIAALVQREAEDRSESLR